jgi:hypothetical protein
VIPFEASCLHVLAYAADVHSQCARRLKHGVAKLQICEELLAARGLFDASGRAMRCGEHHTRAAVHSLHSKSDSLHQGFLAHANE